MQVWDNATVTALRRILAFLVLQGCLLVAASGVARAGERYAPWSSPCVGNWPAYAEKDHEWRSSFVQLLQGPLGYAEANVLVLAEEEFAGARRRTRENVRAAIADLRKRATKDDVVLVVLVGHGSGNDVGDAKFNLIGPDLGAAEWGELPRPMPGRLGLHQRRQRQRAVPAGAVGAQSRGDHQPFSGETFETVFPQFLLEAYRNNGADLDKNDCVSVFEAFAFISSRVREWFEQRAQLATEHAVLDDNGDGVGRLIDDEGADGLLARLTYLRADPPIQDTGNPERTAMLRRRAELNTQLEELRARKNTMPSTTTSARSKRCSWNSPASTARSGPSPSLALLTRRGSRPMRAGRHHEEHDGHEASSGQALSCLREGLPSQLSYVAVLVNRSTPAGAASS